MYKNKKYSEEELRQFVKEDRVTYDIYAELPEDDNRYEVIGGKLEMLSAPLTNHQVLVIKLLKLTTQTCEAEYFILIPPLDVILSPRYVLQPDLIMIHRSRMNIVTRRGIEGAPDLVAEILSPGSRNRDKVRKMQAYALHGVPEYWVIDPVSRLLEKYVLGSGESPQYMLDDVFEEGDRVRSDKMHCANFDISDLFKEMFDH